MRTGAVVDQQKRVGPCQSGGCHRTGVLVGQESPVRPLVGANTGSLYACQDLCALQLALELFAQTEAELNVNTFCPRSAENRLGFPCVRTCYFSRSFSLCHHVHAHTHTRMFFRCATWFRFRWLRSRVSTFQCFLHNNTGQGVQFWVPARNPGSANSSLGSQSLGLTGRRTHLTTS